MRRSFKKIQNVQDGVLYQITLAFLAVISVGFLLYEFLGNPSRAGIEIILNLDTATALIYLADFFVGLFISEKKGLYFKDNWLNLLSSVPLNDTTFRALRLVRLIRTIRMVRAANALASVGQLSSSISRFFGGGKNRG